MSGTRRAITALAILLLLGAIVPGTALAAGGVNVSVSPASVSTDRLGWVTLTATQGGAQDCAASVTGTRTFVFNWGDGTNSTTVSTTSNKASASHRYATLGTLTASVTASIGGSCGKTSNPASSTVTVGNLAPATSLAAPSALVAGAPGSFDAGASSDLDGSVVGYRFTVDGVALPEQASPVLQTSFTSAGAHTVAVVAVDNDGGQGGAVTQPVQVDAAALDSIAVSGVTTLVAGTTETYAVEGADAYGNPVELAMASFAYTAPEAAGPASVCHAEQGVTGCLAVTVVADELATLVVSGPDSLVAGATADFDLAGFDQYGNPVAVAPSTESYTAPTLAGPAVVEVVRLGVTGQKGIVVLADALATISVTGPGSLVAGTSATYALAGFDQHGNPVALDESMLLYTAPTLVGSATVVYEQNGVSGEQDVTVVADALFRIAVDGPLSLVAGTNAEYALAGFDRYDNAVELTESSLLFAAPTSVGAANVCHSESDVSGCLLVGVVADELATIVISGPASVVAGTTEEYALAGFDLYGNDVALEQTTLAFAVPTAAGPAVVSYSEQGVTAQMTIAVLADALHSIAVSGPPAIVAGATESYVVAGFDQYGNGVALAVESIEFTAPTAVGSATVAYAEQGVAGELEVTVVAGALATIVVSGPAAMAAGSTAQFDLAGFDQHGNGVALQQSSLAFKAPQTVGTVAVGYSEGGVTGSKLVQVTPVELEVSISTLLSVYNPLRAYLDGVQGAVYVAFPGAGALEGASVEVTFTHVTLLGQLRTATVSGTTDAEGLFVFDAPEGFNLLGSYEIEATATFSANVGSAQGSYTVGF